MRTFIPYLATGWPTLVVGYAARRRLPDTFETFEPVRPLQHHPKPGTIGHTETHRRGTSKPQAPHFDAVTVLCTSNVQIVQSVHGVRRN